MDKAFLKLLVITICWASIIYAAHLAKMINNFKNVKHKLLETNAEI
jgi:hypothetical protein